VLGIASSGFHSNGYSLLRQAFAPDLAQWRDVLMVPTHLYARFVLRLKGEGCLQAVANITGGGMENIPRALPSGTYLRLCDWAWPEPFLEVQDRTGLSREEMLKTLNCGVGLCLVVAPASVSRCEAVAAEMGFATYDLGEVAAGEAGAAAWVEY
jgi:phosphoribosylformylglycinamidine cyclo-ligase